MCAQRGSPIAADDAGGAPLRYERVGAAAVIAIRRPERRNAIDGPRQWCRLSARSTTTRTRGCWC
jgi:hypothetical protein